MVLTALDCHNLWLKRFGLRNRHVLADTELILIESVAASLQTGNATMEHCITEMKMQ